MADILFIAGNTRSLIANRGDLIREMKQAGHNVSALVPEYDFLPEIADLDIPYRKIDLSRSSINPFAAWKSRNELAQIIHECKPDKVFAYTIKPVVLGVPAARKAGIAEIYAMITGMGYLFTGESLKQQMLRPVACRMYRNALAGCKTVFFQNPDDITLSRKLNIIGENSPVVMTNGSGVNMAQFSRQPLPENQPLTFLMIARLLRDKGVSEFVAAAEKLKTVYGGRVRFQVVGPYDPNLPHAVSKSRYQKWKSSDAVDFLGHMPDVRPWLKQCHVYVLPSYREGTPRSVLEAMATGRAVITTDAPGCRETVADGVNGFLVPPGQSPPLATAMERFISKPERIAEMGEHSYQMAKEKYDVNKVNLMIMASMNLHPPGGGEPFTDIPEPFTAAGGLVGDRGMRPDHGGRS